MLAKIGAFLTKYVLDYIVSWATSMLKAFLGKKKDEGINREVKEEMENAQTEDELRDANRRGSDRLRG